MMTPMKKWKNKLAVYELQMIVVVVFYSNISLLLMMLLLATSALIVWYACSGVVVVVHGQYCCSATNQQQAQMINLLQQIDTNTETVTLNLNGTIDIDLTDLEAINTGILNSLTAAGASELVLTQYGTQRTWNTCNGNAWRTAAFQQAWAAAALQKTPRFTDFGGCSADLTKTVGQASFDDYDTYGLSLANWQKIQSTTLNSTQWLTNYIAATVRDTYPSKNLSLGNWMYLLSVKANDSKNVLDNIKTNTDAYQSKTLGMSLFDIRAAMTDTYAAFGLSLTNWQYIMSQTLNESKTLLASIQDQTNRAGSYTIASWLRDVAESRLTQAGKTAAFLLDSINTNLYSGGASAAAWLANSFPLLQNIATNTASYNSKSLGMSLYDIRDYLLYSGKSAARWLSEISLSISNTIPILQTIAANTQTTEQAAVPQYGTGQFNATIPKDDWFTYLASGVDPAPGAINYGLFPQYSSLPNAQKPNIIQPLAITDVSIGMAANFFTLGIFGIQHTCATSGCPTNGAQNMWAADCTTTSSNYDAGEVDVDEGAALGSMAWMSLTNALNPFINGFTTQVDTNNYLMSQAWRGQCQFKSVNLGGSTGSKVDFAVGLYRFPHPVGNIAGAQDGTGNPINIDGQYWICSPGDVALVVNTSLTYDTFSGGTPLVQSSLSWLELSINAAYYPQVLPEATMYATQKIVLGEIIYKANGLNSFTRQSTMRSVNPGYDSQVFCINKGALYAPAKILHLGAMSTGLTSTNFYNTYSNPPYFSPSTLDNFRQLGYVQNYNYDYTGSSALSGLDLPSAFSGGSFSGAGQVGSSFVPPDHFGQHYILIYVCSKVLQRPIYKARVSTRTNYNTIPTVYYGTGQYVQWLDVYTSEQLDIFNERVAPGILQQMTMNGADDFFIVTDFDTQGCNTAPNEAYYSQAFWALRLSILHY